MLIFVISFSLPMKWILKALVQKSISFLPGSQYLNAFFQKHITRGMRLTESHFSTKLIPGIDHLIHFSKWSKNGLSNKHFFELGTGWYPIIPICCFLAGARKISTLDIRSWLDREGLMITLDRFIEHQSIIESRFEEGGIPAIPIRKWEILKEIRESDESLEKSLKMLGIEPHIGDARQLPFDNASIDFISSNNTFEHIYPHILEGILKEFKRVIRPGGVMTHFIDMTDHFAHLDASINEYQFLRFSKRQWKFIDNRIQPQNRLRLPHYESMYEKLQIPIDEKVLWPYDLSKLEGSQIHRDFADIPKDQLAVIHCYLISRL